MNSGSPPNWYLEEVEHLLQTALYNSGGEMVEGGFVDRWESNAHRAIEALASRGGSSEFDAALAEKTEKAVRAPDVPAEAGAALLRGLHPRSRALVGALLADPNPHLRTMAVQAGFPVLEPAQLLRALRDASPAVRVAAVQTVAKHRRQLSEVERWLIQLLDDPDRRVREAASQAVGFYNNPEAAEALVRYLDEDATPQIRTELIERIARQTRTEGVHVPSTVLRERVGEPIRALLLRELHHADPELRSLVVRALERLRDPEVAQALFHRLQEEEHPNVRRTLVLFEGYPLVAEQALPVLSHWLQADPDPLIRSRIAFLLEGFGPSIPPLLVAALDDRDSSVRRAAAMSLGKVGDLSALSGLVREFTLPASRYFRTELKLAVQDILIRAEARLSTKPSAELQQKIHKRVQALEANSLGQWPIRVARDEHQALPLHGNSAFLWCLSPAGAILRIDHDDLRHSADEETDAVVRFAVVMQGAVEYPELWPLVPLAPKNTRPCLECSARGYTEENSCLSCSGLGWHIDHRWLSR